MSRSMATGLLYRACLGCLEGSVAEITLPKSIWERVGGFDEGVTCASCPHPRDSRCYPLIYNDADLQRALSELNPPPREPATPPRPPALPQQFKLFAEDS